MAFQEAKWARFGNRVMSPTSTSSRAAPDGPMPCRSINVVPVEATNQDGWDRVQRLSFDFAAAIGYRRGGRDPNATAIMNRLRDDINVTGPVTDHIATLSLEAGLAFLGFETRTLFR
ncbi:hypothetical protein [Micromonospora sp. 15K316]|uniref:hypothetical protein n=1 Tax=Micromonospora sp. 15K316 TaxID=2530376 RepID=UPI001FB689CA|nr:hypothetical protein [Micromonospora sp. 15K316]